MHNPSCQEKAQIPIGHAYETWVTELFLKRNLGSVDSQIVGTAEALSRVTCGPIRARSSFPHFFSAAINGVAVEARLTLGASVANPQKLIVGRDCCFVDAGAPVVAPYDAVVPFGEIQLDSCERAVLTRSSDPWRNVRPAGEEIEDHEVILPSGHWIGPLDIGALLAGGVMQVEVRRRPKVAIVAVGRRLVPSSVPPGLGEVVDTISPILIGLVRETGGEPCPIGVVDENICELAEVLTHLAHDHDVVLVVPGQNRVTELISSAISSVGEVVAQNVAVHPGNNVVLGCIDSCPVTAVSCHPMSAYIIFCLFVRPILQVLLGEPRFQEIVEWANLATDVHSIAGVEEYQRVRLGVVDCERVAVPLSRGTDQIMSLVRADGVIRIPSEQEKIEAGSRVPIKRFRPLRAIDHTVIVAGTHDISFDLLRKYCLLQCPDLRLVWASVGSERGVQKMRSHLCHIASMHIFDSYMGQYNIPYLQRTCAQEKLTLINLFRRPLGFAVLPGNPLHIQAFADLVRSDVRFVNRPQGSGTRKLLEYCLGQANIDEHAVEGYSLVSNTHLGVASVVASGGADAGLVIPAAAKALGLDFVPLVQEQLDFAIPVAYMNSLVLKSFIEVMRSEDFRREAQASLPFYDFSRSGEIIWKS